MSDIKSTFQNLGLFSNVSADFLNSVQNQAISKNEPKGHVIFLSGDEAKNFYLIRSGWVKLFRETLDGSQAIVDILTGGQIFGETAIFEDFAYPYSAEVAEDAEIVLVPLSLLKSEIENNNKVALDMLGAMAKYRKHQDQELEHRALQNAPQRIGCFLLRLAQSGDDQSVIHLPYDKMLVASRLGMQPETFSRALKKLKEKTGIAINGSTVQIQDIDELSAFSCSACSSMFPCKDLKAQKDT